MFVIFLCFFHSLLLYIHSVVIKKEINNRKSTVALSPYGALTAPLILTVLVSAKFQERWRVGREEEVEILPLAGQLKWAEYTVRSSALTERCTAPVVWQPQIKSLVSQNHDSDFTLSQPYLLLLLLQYHLTQKPIQSLRFTPRSSRPHKD